MKSRQCIRLQFSIRIKGIVHVTFFLPWVEREAVWGWMRMWGWAERAGSSWSGLTESTGLHCSHSQVRLLYQNRRGSIIQYHWRLNPIHKRLLSLWALLINSLKHRGVLKHRPANGAGSKLRWLMCQMMNQNKTRTNKQKHSMWNDRMLFTCYFCCPCFLSFFFPF